VAAKAKRRKGMEARGAGTRPRPTGPGGFKRKSCLLCRAKAKDVDYKNIGLLRRFVSERGKIRSRRMTGACRKHQRLVAVAIKRAREMALLPYITGNNGASERSRSDGRRRE
jgi:small subunit ribosomal protein S18